MSDTDNLQQRLRELAAARHGDADWEDVLRRAGGRFSVGRLPRRRLALAVAAAFVVVASVVGVLVTRGASPGATGAQGPTWDCPHTGIVCGPTGPQGPTGAIGSPLGPDRQARPDWSAGPTGAFVAVGPTGHNGPTGATGYPYFGPLLLTPRQLAAEGRYALGALDWAGTRSIYWAGPRKGFHYEYGRSSLDYLYVRYLPDGIRVGDPGRNFLIVATYLVPGAFTVLKKQADAKAIPGPNGSIVLVSSSKPTSVYIAFPNVDYEIEIYDPSPAVALSTAESGDVQPVG